MKKNLIAHNKAVYDTIASHFSDTRTFLWDDLKPLFKYTKDGDNVLDLGCGNGRLYQLFDGLSIDYTGADQSGRMIDIARNRVGENKMVKFEVAEMTQLPFARGQFDVLYCIAAFHHLPSVASRRAALREMRRVLKKGGLLVMTNWNLNSNGVKKKAAQWQSVGVRGFMVPWMNQKGEVLGQRYYYGFDMEEISGLLAQAGFEIEEKYFTNKGRKGGMTSAGNIVHIARRK